MTAKSWFKSKRNVITTYQLPLKMKLSKKFFLVKPVIKLNKQKLSLVHLAEILTDQTHAIIRPLKTK